MVFPCFSWKILGGGKGNKRRKGGINPFEKGI